MYISYMKDFLFILILVQLNVKSVIAMPDTLLPLWTENIPNTLLPNDLSETWEQKEIVRISNVIEPTIEVFLPTRRSATNVGVLIMPGGGYSILAYDWEGREVAKFLNAHGISAFVLKYRLPNARSSIEPHITPLLDARRAMRMIRSNADKWLVSGDKIGVMGFSAGGHLASSLLTCPLDLSRFDSDSIDLLDYKPNFGGLIYPVTTMDPAYAHTGSQLRLLGENPAQELIDAFSPEFNITDDTPPIFLLHTMDDQSVPIQGTVLLYQSLLRKGITTEAHFFPSGGHGYGLARKHPHLNSWPETFVEWIRSLP